MLFIAIESMIHVPDNVSNLIKITKMEKEYSRFLMGCDGFYHNLRFKAILVTIQQIYWNEWPALSAKWLLKKYAYKIGDTNYIYVLIEDYLINT